MFIKSLVCWQVLSFSKWQLQMPLLHGSSCLDSILGESKVILKTKKWFWYVWRFVIRNYPNLNLKIVAFASKRELYTQTYLLFNSLSTKIIFHRRRNKHALLSLLTFISFVSCNQIIWYGAWQKQSIKEKELLTSTLVR